MWPTYELHILVTCNAVVIYYAVFECIWHVNEWNTYNSRIFIYIHTHTYITYIRRKKVFSRLASYKHHDPQPRINYTHFAWPAWRIEFSRNKDMKPVRSPRGEVATARQGEKLLSWCCMVIIWIIIWIMNHNINHNMNNSKNRWRHHNSYGNREMGVACGVLYILTSKCASRQDGVHFLNISTSKSGPTLVCFVHFHLEMCFAPQRRALFRHRNF